MRAAPVPARWLLVLAFLAVLAAASFGAVLYRPDRPRAAIPPGSSPAPAFAVQVLRPRLGLPLGGLVPPQLFGLEGHLGFDSTHPGAAIGSVGPERVELSADDWDLVLVLDPDGHVSPATELTFELVFEGRRRRVRCRPGEPPKGSADTVELADSSELSGRFDVELARCEDARTGQPLGWPPRPLVLHGSFDRLPVGSGHEDADGGERRAEPR